MTNEKPEKKVYPKKVQDKIYAVSKEVVLSVVKENPKIYSANAFGSIIRREFGVYDGVYKNKRYGSDVDVVCVVDSTFKTPKGWKLIKKYPAFDEYDVDSVENHMLELGKKELPIHPIKFLIYIPGVHDYEDAKKWSGIDKEDFEKKGESVEEWYKDLKKLKKALEK
jgi:hypothetical protein